MGIAQRQSLFQEVAQSQEGKVGGNIHTLDQLTTVGHAAGYQNMILEIHSGNSLILEIHFGNSLWEFILEIHSGNSLEIHSGN